MANSLGSARVEVLPRDNSLVKVALLRSCFPLSCHAICPTLGVVVIGTKRIASEGVCVQLSFPCFAVFTVCVRVFCLFSHLLEVVLRWLRSLFQAVLCSILTVFLLVGMNVFIKGSVCSILYGSYLSLNLLSTERKG